MRPSVKPSRLAACLLGGLLTTSVAQPAFAEGSNDAPAQLTQAELDEAERLFFEGLGAYRDKRYEDAAVAFQKAFVNTRHRDLLFNIARSREQLGDKSGAVEWYRAYLQTTPADETAVIHRIRQLGGDPNPPKKDELVAKPDGPTPPETEIVEEGAGAWPWVALTVGVAAAGAGAYFGFTALDEASNARDAQLRSEAEKSKDAAESNALLADISFGVGALAVGTAVVLWLQSDSEASTSGQIQVAPTDSGAQIGYFLRF